MQENEEILKRIGISFTAGATRHQTGETNIVIFYRNIEDFEFNVTLSKVLNFLSQYPKFWRNGETITHIYIYNLQMISNFLTTGETYIFTISDKYFQPSDDIQDFDVIGETYISNRYLRPPLES